MDLIGGARDRAREKSFDETTLTPVFSTTKAVASLMIARLVDQEKLWWDQPVADIWPAFGQAGKAGVTVEQALSHQEGLCGLAGPMEPADWFDWVGVCRRLAEMAPLWPPGSASGYHPVTFGYIVGEIFRRVDGRTLGTALREDIAAPHGLDLWIGLPDAEHGRCADMRRPPALPDLGEMTEPKRLAFMTPWASPGGRSGAEWRRFEIPSANGHATAPALARMMAILACDGVLDGKRLLAPGVSAQAARRRIVGDDLVMPYRMAWGQASSAMRD